MITDITSLIARRELARRASGGIDITLFWSPHDNSTSIEVWRPDTEELITFPVAPEAALDAFYHPFAHLAPQRVATPTAIDAAVIRGDAEMN
jgi:hypothetical protein